MSEVCSNELRKHDQMNIPIDLIGAKTLTDKVKYICQNSDSLKKSTSRNKIRNAALGKSQPMDSNPIRVESCGESSDTFGT